MPHALRRSAVEDVRIEPPRRPDKNTLDRRGESNTSRRSARPIVFSGPITIKVEAQPGQDGADLAKQIKDALAEQARAAEARRASSYEDMD